LVKVPAPVGFAAVDRSVDQRRKALGEAVLQRMEALMASSAAKQAMGNAAAAGLAADGAGFDADRRQDGAAEPRSV